MSKLSRNLTSAVHAYIVAFEKKHECNMEYFVNDDIMGIVEIADHFFNVSDLILDIDNKCPKDLIWEWYDQTLESKQPMNYQTYIKGLRYEPHTRLPGSQ